FSSSYLFCFPCFFLLSFLLLRPLTSTLFPYTTLFRSRSYLPETQPAFHTWPECLHFPLTNPLRWPIPSHFDELFFEMLLSVAVLDRKSTRLNSSHVKISYAVFCLKKKKNKIIIQDEIS